MKQIPAADSAIFVANKWDLLEQQQSEIERQNYLRLLAQGLQSRWSGFRQHQLLTLNAKLACTAQQLGESTNDMRRLCTAIKKALPYGMDNMILKSLRFVVCKVLMLLLMSMSVVLNRLCVFQWSTDADG